MVRKKAQMKIQQMMFVLMAITLFIILVFLFVIVFKTSGLKKQATEIAENEALLIVMKLANYPEFSCGNSFGTGKIACVDADKIIALIDIKAYEDFWPVDGIKIRKIYPKSEQDVVCTRSNYPDCNLFDILPKSSEGGAWQSNFVVLCRKESYEKESYDKCELARIMVSYKILK
jgi:hypothetical protein